ncbi:MAG TPA: hypothetical protein PLA90_03880 [Candidatus Sumerlaeota bacterium]|nr:hypothetical protein [Candidatus Sumerlaeota bacterium]
MNATIQFHAASTEELFEVIGCADRDLLLDIGVTLGTEFRAPSDDEERDEFEEEESDEASEWDHREEEADAAQEIITKMIMSGLPPDLSDDEAYAVQDYFAATLARDSEAHLFDPEALSEQLEDDFGEPVATHALGLLTSGVKESQMLELCEWVAEQDVSRELLVRLHMLIFGRLPESDEPTFNDTDEGAYAARFGYLTGQEVALVADEMSELTEEAEGEIRSLACLLATLMHYCASHARDLVVTLEE